MIKKKLYSFSLPVDITKEAINERAAKLNTIPAMLLEVAIRIMIKCSAYLLEYLDDLAAQHCIPDEEIRDFKQWAIIEQIIIDQRARRDAYAKYWGETPQADIMFQTGADGNPVLGEKLYEILYRYYEGQEMLTYERNWLARDYSKLDAEGKKIVDELRRRHGWKQ